MFIKGFFITLKSIKFYLSLKMSVLWNLSLINEYYRKDKFIKLQFHLSW